MAISIFELFKVGIGPSSSHTVGPMRAALLFVNGLKVNGLLDRVNTVKAELYGSLGATGKGHGSDKAVLLGLLGETPDLVDIESIDAKLAEIRSTTSIRLLGIKPVTFIEKEHLLMYRQRTLPAHPNGMRFTAFDAAQAEIANKVYYSVGGGFVVDENAAGEDRIVSDTTLLPYAFDSGNQLLALCQRDQISVSQLMLENEKVWRPEQEIRDGLLKIWQVMQDCVKRGCEKEGVLPGPMQVRRRAAELHRSLSMQAERSLRDPLTTLDWLTCTRWRSMKRMLPVGGW